MINVVAHGNPLEYKTWSGTPAHISEVLSQNKYLNDSFDFSLRAALRKPLYLLSKLYYNQNVELHRSPFVKYARSLYVTLKQPLLRKSNCLHFSNMALPMLLNIKKQKHFLVIDSTWHLWSAKFAFKENFNPRFISDIEWLEKKTLKQVKHIFSLSEYVKEDLIKHYEVPDSKITVIGTGTGTIRPYFGKKDYSNHEILFVANKRFEDKGGPFLIEGFNMALKTNPKLVLNIVGIDKNKITIKSDLKNVKVHGFIDINSLQLLFNKCSLFAMPAINEPWGLVYLESLLCKCPILGLNTNAFPELSNNGNHGFILKEYNTEALSKLLLEAFSDLEKLKFMGESGQKCVLQNYTWEKVAESIINIIKSYE